MSAPATTVHPVGIDLGTTYSCLSYLTPHGQPETLPNADGELSTPSVVLFDGDDVLVGTEALRSVVSQPERGVVHVKRSMGDRQKCWVIDGQVYRPPDISAMILRKLLYAAEERIGPVRHAVITVPAQFSDIQRNDTIEAGLKAGLERVDIINEPVAAALCYVLSEGIWFSEIARDQTVMVFDLGGGTFDLSLVKYNKSEVRVIASGGDLHLGGLDWNKVLEEFLCDEFSKLSNSDPRLDRESLQALAIEVEHVKRTLTVRQKASAIVQHQGHRKVFGLDRDLFEMLSKDLVQRTENITRGLLKAHKLGWQNVDAVLVTGGSSRMPMIRAMLQRISVRTLNSSLSPDQSICHGAAYYAGMILSGQKLERTSLNKEATARLASIQQHSVNARALGILVRDVKSGQRFPHYLIPANSPLPCSVQQQFGTVSDNQRRVQLHIVESGATAQDPYVELGTCLVEGLAQHLPSGSPVLVTIRYDEQARVHVEASDVTSGARAEAVIIRKENIASLPSRAREAVDAQLVSPVDSKVNGARPAGVQLASRNVASAPTLRSVQATPVKPATRPVAADSSSTTQKQPAPSGRTERPRTARTSQAASGANLPPQFTTAVPLEEAERPVPLCNRCGDPLNFKGECRRCAGRSHGPKKVPGSVAKPAVRKPRPSPPAPSDETEYMLPNEPPRPAKPKRQKP